MQLRYPRTWTRETGYDERFAGKDGFFQLSAVGGEGLTLDGAAENEAQHKLQSYGSQPRVEASRVAGQDARLILPSDDQLEDMKHQAALIIRYPRAIVIDGRVYSYFVLYADREHIQPIARTLIFTSSASLAD